MTPIECDRAPGSGDHVRPEDYRVELSAACHDEIRRAVDEIRAYPLPTIVLRPDDFAMPACREQMARVRRILDHGVRFAIVDRLPIAEMDAGEATAIYWILSSMISRPVAQKLDGTLDLRCSRYRAASASRIGGAAGQDQHRDPLSQRQCL